MVVASAEIKSYGDVMIETRRAEARKNGTLANTVYELKIGRNVTWSDEVRDLFDILLADGFQQRETTRASARAYYCPPCHGWVKGFPLEQGFDNSESGMEHAAGSNYFCGVCHTQIGTALTGRS